MLIFLLYQVNLSKSVSEPCGPSSGHLPLVSCQQHESTTSIFTSLDWIFVHCSVNFRYAFIHLVGRGTGRERCLAQENTVTQGLKPGQTNPVSNVLTIRSAHFPHSRLTYQRDTYNLMLDFFITHMIIISTIIVTQSLSLSFYHYLLFSFVETSLDNGGLFWAP